MSLISRTPVPVPMVTMPASVLGSQDKRLALMLSGNVETLVTSPALETSLMHVLGKSCCTDDAIIVGVQLIG